MVRISDFIQRCVEAISLRAKAEGATNVNDKAKWMPKEPWNTLDSNIDMSE